VGREALVTGVPVAGHVLAFNRTKLAALHEPFVARDSSSDVPHLTLDPTGRSLIALRQEEGGAPVFGGVGLIFHKRCHPGTRIQSLGTLK